MGDTPNEIRSNSLDRAVLRDALLVGALGALAEGAAMLAGSEVEPPLLLVVVAGAIFAVLGGAGAAAVSWLIRARQPVGGVALGLFLALVLVVLGTTLPRFLGSRRAPAPEALGAAGAPPVVRPEDRMPPWVPLEQRAVAEGRELRHPTLGFALAHPGDAFAPVENPPDPSGVFESGLASRWIWDDPAAGTRVVVLASLEMRTEPEVRALLEGLLRGLRRDAPGEWRGSHDVRWGRAGGEAGWYGTAPGGANVAIRCLREVGADGGSTPLVCALHTGGATQEDARGFVDTLRVEPTGGRAAAGAGAGAATGAGAGGGAS